MAASCLVETVLAVSNELVDTIGFERAVALFRPILRPEMLRELIEDELVALMAHQPPPTKNAPGGQLRIVSQPGADVRARIVQPGHTPAGAIRTLTRHTLIGNAGRDAFAVRHWHQPEPQPNDVFVPHKTIVEREPVWLEPGDAVALQAAHDAFDIIPSDRPAVVLTVAGQHIVALAWLYRRDSRHPVSVEPAGRDWLLVRELLSFADAVGDASLAPVMGSLAAHPSHFVRWAAAQSLLRLAPEAGHEMLRVLAEDNHPQVRYAARHRLGVPVSA